jgi:hypothetical protein
VYGTANRTINTGLSRGARILLGSVAALFGVMMFVAAQGSTHPVGIMGFGVFCLLIAVACGTWGRVRQFVGSIIGTVIFLAGIWYLVDELLSGPATSGSRSEPSVLNAIFFLVFFGIPGAAYAYNARFGYSRKES